MCDDYYQALQNAGVRNVYSPDNTLYSERVESYWSLTSRLAPKCFVLPWDAEEVSVVVRTLVRDTRCRFAVRSGGHSSTAGASSIVDGVTIDLSGRIGTVGVGGLLTGGGCSLYLFRQGLACDSVHSFEVVLADGRIVTASSAENADLFEALKGGGGNFGIVTRFNMMAFRTSPIWSASLVHPESVGQVHLSALRKWIDNVKNYQDSSVFVFWSYRPALKQTVVITSLADVSGTASPPIFNDFLAILGAVSSTVTTTNMSTIALNTQTEGYRNIWFTLTFKNDEETLARAVDLHGRLVEEMKTESSDGDFETQCFFQPLPAIVGRHGQERGGNILGISEKEGNAVILLGSLGVNGLDQEALGRKKMLAWKDELEQYTKGASTYIPYRYMNYADGSQDVVSSYGEQSVLKMQAVSRKYDPDGIFQTRVPGGFKIPDITGMAVTNGG
ncbi:FAD-binding domain-containing protein [Biscogniauxia mediterranea]|nr:FAD-binding domain-containing protein [Biscogniauxia mediterranea]